MAPRGPTGVGSAPAPRLSTGHHRGVAGHRRLPDRTAFAARTGHASLRAIGVFRNPALLVGIAVKIVFALTQVYTPFLHPLFGTAALSAANSCW